MKGKATQLFISAFLILCLTGAMFTKQARSENLDTVKSEAEKLEKSGKITISSSSLKDVKSSIPPNIKPLSEIVQTSKDVLVGDGDGSLRGVTNPFNNSFQTSADIEAFVDKRLKASKIEYTSEERKMLLSARAEEVYKLKLDIGSSVPGLIEGLRKKREASKTVSSASTEGFNDFTVVK